MTALPYFLSNHSEIELLVAELELTTEPAVRPAPFSLIEKRSSRKPTWEVAAGQLAIYAACAAGNALDEIDFSAIGRGVKNAVKSRTKG